MASTCHVAVMPYPGRGHVNPMLVLARQLVSHDIHVTFIVTEEWLSLINSSHPPPPQEPNFHFQTIPNCIPSENGRAKNFQQFIEAVYTKMREPFEEMLERLETPPVAIIADTYLPWVVEVGNEKGINVISVFTMSASFFSVLLNFEKTPPPENQEIPIGEKDECLEKYITNLSSIKLSDVGPIFTAPSLKLALQAISSSKKSQCIVFTSFYELESRIIDSLKNDLNLPIYTLGPSIPYMIEPKDENNYNHLTWLISQPKDSVLYISLGSFLSVSPSQLEEIAMGVRLSGVKFLWVARENASVLQELCGNKGLVVSWCDQLNVLKNDSIGGFLTHCGFNSTLETLFAGVPVLCFPIFWDQLIDRTLLVDEW